MFNMSHSRLVAVDFITQMRQNVVGGGVLFSRMWQQIATNFIGIGTQVLYHKPRLNTGDERRADVIQHKTNKPS